MHSSQKDQVLGLYHSNEDLISRNVLQRIAFKLIEKQKLTMEDMNSIKRFISMEIVQVDILNQLQDAKVKKSIMDEAVLFSEPCPICQAAIPATEPRIGTCSNGHVWNRCQLSATICTDSSTTCYNCKSKRSITMPEFEYCISCRTRIY
jgi:formate dehydrogenase maturation protein FdhE